MCPSWTTHWLLFGILCPTLGLYVFYIPSKDICFCDIAYILSELALGGTAVGTGLNTPSGN